MAKQTITVTGNQVTVIINGVQIPVMTTARATDDYGMEPVTGIGDIHVREYVPTVARHAMAIAKFMMTKEQAVSAGLILENGDDAMQNNTFDIEFFAKNGPLLRKYKNCKNISSDINIQANRLIVQDANFVATDVTGDFNSLGQ